MRSMSRRSGERPLRRKRPIRPPPLVVPDVLSPNIAIPERCYERAQLSAATHLVPVSWPAEGPRAAGATRRGSKRPINEDRIFADARAAVYGVCDGHGGEEAAEFAADALLTLLSPRASHDHVCEAFRNLNHQLYMHIPDTQYVGTTVTAAVLSPGGAKVRLVHLGDCRAVLIDSSGVAHSLTVDHSPTRADETARIHNAGGLVVNGRVNSVLSVSRALGDFKLHNLVSIVPDVIDINLCASDHLLVIGSDGFFDHVSDMDLADALAEMACVPNTAAVPIDLKAAVVSLINLAVSRRATDDISLVLIDVRQRRSLSPRNR